MKESKKFDVQKLDKLNNPERLIYLNPDVIWDKLKLLNPEILVDIGAGTGFFAVPFCKKMNGGRIYACDISEEMIGWMKENLPTFHNCSIQPVKTQEDCIPLNDNIADLVYMINVYHELENPEMILKEANRLLKESAKIAIIDWKAEETQGGPPVYIRIPKDTVKQKLIDSGFLKVSSYDILPYHYFLVGEK